MAGLLILVALMGFFFRVAGWEWIINQVIWAWGPLLLSFYLFGPKRGILVAAAWFGDYSPEMETSVTIPFWYPAALELHARESGRGFNLDRRKAGA